MESQIPRRANLELNTPAELAIRDAMFAVEDVGAHPLLTDAVSLLYQARSKVADFVDSNGERTTMQPTITALSLEITDDLIRPVATPPGVVAAASLPFSEDVVLAVVKGLVEGLATNFGDSFNDLVLTQRDKIRKVVGPIALKSLDELIHELQD